VVGRAPAMVSGSAYFDFTAKHFHERMVRHPIGGGTAFPSLLQLREERVAIAGGLTYRRLLPAAGAPTQARAASAALGMMLFSRRLATAPGCARDRSSILTRDDMTHAPRDHFEFFMGGGGHARAFRLSETIRIMVCSSVFRYTTGVATTSSLTSRSPRARRSTQTL